MALTETGLLKRSYRKAAQTRRKRLGGPLHGDALLPHWPDRFADLAVAGYYPLETEFDCLPLLQTLRLAGVSIGLPKMQGEGKPLTFKRWSAGEPLETVRHNVREPLATAAIHRPDIILTPLLAFDANGGRLGWGGGYYDRTLAAYPGALAIGVGFDEQEIDHVPMEAHDRRLDGILTPSGMRDFIQLKAIA